MDVSGPSILFSLRDFFTPTVLFVVINIVIATIALTSRTVRHHHQEPAPDHHRPGPTTLERVRSIGLFRFGSHDLPHQPEPDHTHQTHYHHPPSALERVRSGLFGFGSRDIAPPEPDHAHQTHYDQQQHHHQPSALERVRSGLFGFGSRDDIAQPEPDHTLQTHYHQQHHQPSVLERVRSGLLGYGSRDDIPQPGTQHFQTQFQTAAPDPDPEHYDMDHHFRRIQSETARPKPAMAEERGALRKLASALSWRAPEAEVRRRPVAAAAAVEEEEEVDARADDFINRFKQQLKLQRLDSIMRYKEMLARGR